MGQWIPRQQQPPRQHSSVSRVQGSRRKLVQTFFIRSEGRFSARGWWHTALCWWRLGDLSRRFGPCGWFRKVLDIDFHVPYACLVRSSFSRCSPTTQVLLCPVCRGLRGGFEPSGFWGTADFLFSVRLSSSLPFFSLRVRIFPYAIKVEWSCLSFLSKWGYKVCLALPWSKSESHFYTWVRCPPF